MDQAIVAAELTELTAEAQAEVSGGGLWSWLFGEPTYSGGGGSFGGGGASGSW
jgi:uncharacterized membrane protein YgcG